MAWTALLMLLVSGTSRNYLSFPGFRGLTTCLPGTPRELIAESVGLVNECLGAVRKFGTVSLIAVSSSHAFPAEKERKKTPR